MSGSNRPDGTLRPPEGPTAWSAPGAEAPSPSAQAQGCRKRVNPGSTSHHPRPCGRNADGRRPRWRSMVRRGTRSAQARPVCGCGGRGPWCRIAGAAGGSGDFPDVGDGTQPSVRIMVEGCSNPPAAPVRGFNGRVALHGCATYPIGSDGVINDGTNRQGIPCAYRMCANLSAECGPFHVGENGAGYSVSDRIRDRPTARARPIRKPPPPNKRVGQSCDPIRVPIPFSVNISKRIA